MIIYTYIKSYGGESVKKILAWFESDDRPSIAVPRRTRWENGAALLFSLALSLALLLICTRSSPLYPLNDWVDSNCFFTVGKSMVNGKVLYRDIYEQKGILLYVVHAIGYLISNTTFIGVFLFETVGFGLFLYLGYKTARLFVPFGLSLAILPPMGHAILTSVSLRQGDSAEQMCLPFLLLPIYLLLKSVKTGDGRGIPKMRHVFLLGMCAACVLWIKYTLLGVYIGYVICALIFCITDKAYMRLLKLAIAFVAGAAVISIPIFVYFAVNGAMGDLFEAYFYNNMFLYTDKRTFTEKLSSIASLSVWGLSYNKLWGALSYLGFFSLVLDVRHPRITAGAVMLYAGNVFFIYYGGIGWYYYSLGMAALSVAGFVAVARVIYFLWQKYRSAVILIFEKASPRLSLARNVEQGFITIFDQSARRAVAYVLAAVCAVSLGALYTERALHTSDNVFYMEQKREDIWQEKFAKIINASDEKTMLNYSCLDLGVYTTANIVPTEKYFVRLNIPLQEMNEQLDSAITEQRVKFVVCRGYPPALVRQYYTIIAHEVSHLEFEDSEYSYYLLERK